LPLADCAIRNGIWWME